MPSAEVIRERLRQPGPDGPAARLADLVIAHLLAQPVHALLDPGLAVQGLRAWLGSDRAHALLAGLAEDAIAQLRAADQPAEEWIPAPLRDALRVQAQRPYAPDRATALAVLDREPVRALLRALVVEALVAFGRKLRAPLAENTVAQGLGGLSGWAAAQLKARSGALGSFAAGALGAVSQEIERQIEQRAAEFADGAVSRMLRQLADALCDPAQAESQAALRLAILDGALELQSSAVAKEIDALAPAEAADRFRRALAGWLARPEAEAAIAGAARSLADRLGARPMGEVLAEMGLLDPARELLRAALLKHLAPFLETEAFAAWVAGLY